MEAVIPAITVLVQRKEIHLKLITVYFVLDMDKFVYNNDRNFPCLLFHPVCLGGLRQQSK